MRVFNGEVVIGTDGAVSCVPRGNYADKWAVRPKDFEDEKVREEVRQKVAEWFNAQNAGELEQRAQESVDTFRKNIKAGCEHLLEKRVEKAMERFSIQCLVNNRHTQNSAEWKIYTAHPHAKLDDFKKYLATLMSPTLVAEIEQRARDANFKPISQPAKQSGFGGTFTIVAGQPIQQSASQFQENPNIAAHKQYCERFIHSEIQHAFGGIAGDDTQGRLKRIADQICKNPDDETAYAELKALIQGGMKALRADPLQYIDGMIAYYKRLPNPAISSQERIEKFDSALYEALKSDDNKKTTSEFRHIVENMPLSCIVSPSEDARGSQQLPSLFSRTVYLETPAGGMHTGAASADMPFIIIGGNGTESDQRLPNYNVFSTIKEETAHAIDHNARLDQDVRKILWYLPGKFTEGIKPYVPSGNPSQLNIAAMGLEGDKWKFGEELAKSITRKFRYPNKWEIPGEIRAEILELVFDGSVPEQDKETFLNKIGIGEQIGTLVQNLTKEKTLRLTYPPGSVEQETMDCLDNIEFLGPNHYEYLGRAKGAARV